MYFIALSSLELWDSFDTSHVCFGLIVDICTFFSNCRLILSAEMGKFRPRLKGKGRRWLKGHSSSSNPETKKYRDVAKSRFFQEGPGQGNLTSDALKKHNAFLGVKEDDSESMVDDSGTSGATFKTFQTFASDWSSCSNQSFGRLMTKFRPDSSLHKEMLAILAAVTEVIKSNGGQESVTEYFAALMTTLDVTETEDSITAVLSLLGMGIKSVPQNILRFKFAETSKSFMDLLAKFAESENNVALRSLLGCLSVLMRAQDSSVWSNSSTMHVCDSILAFTTHMKPKVRKAAQHAIIVILKGDGALNHPGAGHVAKFCVRQLESTGALGGSTTTLHILCLLKEVLSTFPKVQLKAACECVLKVMTLGSVLVTSCGMQALHGLLVSRPPESNLTPQLNARLVSALFDYQPPAPDTQPTLAWLAVMQEAHINLARVELNLCCGALPRFFSSVTQLWLSGRPEVMTAATHTLTSIVRDCVGPAGTPQQEPSVLRAFASVEAGLGYRFHQAWPHVLYVLGTFFEVAGVRCHAAMLPCLVSLAELHDSHSFSFRNELERAVGMAIRSMGPRRVLQAIPLEISARETSREFRRSWLLPVLRESIANCELQFFVEYFLPLATVCRNHSAALGEQNDQIGAHSYDLLQSQVWALLPSFCQNPTDVKQSFKSIARVLGSALGERKDLRLSVMLSLRRLLATPQEGGGDPEGRAEVARFSKNFLPILFNLYATKPSGTDEEGIRLAAYETIKVFLAVTAEELNHDLFDRAMVKLDGVATEDQFSRESLLDLLRALLPHQDPPRLTRLYERCEVDLVKAQAGHREQKKAYRVLEELCGCASEGCKSFVDQNLPRLQKVLLRSVAVSAVSSQGPRLRCLTHLVSKMDRRHRAVLSQVVPEAVLCCKEVNEKTRESAFNLLVHIGEAMQKWSDKPVSDTLRDYLGLVMAGLAGSPNLTSASLLALAKITHIFKDHIPADLLQLMLDNACLLLTSATREIAAAALSYTKMFVSSYPNELIGPALPGLVGSMSAMTDDCKRHLRLQWRRLLDRLTRKFGCDVVAGLVPASDAVTHRRLRNLRKLQARKLRRRREDAEEEEEGFSVRARPTSIEDILAESDDSDMDVDEPVAKKKSGKNKPGGKAWIQEDADSIIDFTDTGAARKISATKPGQLLVQDPTVRKAKPFKTAPDGRLIIRDDGDSDGEKSTARGKFAGMGSDSDADLEVDSKSKAGTSKSSSGRKRKLSTGTEVSSKPPMKYQAGGSGIHRPVRRGKKVVQEAPMGSTGAEYKAKKARGDMKRKGKPDPFAYMPLSRKLLNKRKKMKSVGQFTSLVKGASKGAQRGKKMRAGKQRK